MILKVIGVLLVAFGLVDLVGSFVGFDVWTDFIKIQLPEIIWTFTAYIEIGLGAFLFRLGSREAAIAENLDDQGDPLGQ